MAIELQKSYRDRVKGLVGIAVAEQMDGDVNMVQLSLNKEHLNGEHDAQGHDMRWYSEDRLTPVAAQSAA